MLLYLLLQCLLQLTSCSIDNITHLKTSENATSFRIAHGVKVNDMFAEKLDHLVRIFIRRQRVVFGRGGRLVPYADAEGQPEYSLGTCTGMKMTADQLRGVRVSEGKVDAGYILTAGHCVLKVENTKKFNEITKKTETIRYEIRSVWIVSNRLYAPTPFFTANDPVVHFDPLLIGHIHEAVWSTYLYYGDDGFQKDGSGGAVAYIDIAILKLQKPVSTTVRNIDFSHLPDDTTACRLAGWGVDQNNKDNDRLMRIKSKPKVIQILSKENCLEEKRRQLQYQFKLDGITDDGKKQHLIQAVEVENMYTRCSLHRSGSTACMGDSGTPLMCTTHGAEEVFGVYIRSSLEVVRRIALKNDWFPWIKKIQVGCKDREGIWAKRQITTYAELARDETKTFLQTCVEVLQDPNPDNHKDSDICFHNRLEIGQNDFETTQCTSLRSTLVGQSETHAICTTNGKTKQARLGLLLSVIFSWTLL